MHCLRHLALLMLLVPMPSCSPFLLLLISMVVYMAVRPCGYCVATLIVVFFSTSPSSPFLAALSPDSTSGTGSVSSEPMPLSAPIPDRGAFFLNGGRVFDPAILGTTVMQRVWQDPPAVSSPATETNDSESEAAGGNDKQEGDDVAAGSDTAQSRKDETPASRSWWPLRWSSPFKAASTPDPTPLVYPSVPPARPLPPGYFDLRLGGVGLVLDFGWRRTEQGLSWEVEEQQHAADVRRYRRAERQQRRAAAAGSTGTPAAATPPASQAKTSDSGHSGWLGVSFADVW